MNVKFISGPRTGETAHLEQHVAAGLVAAGLAVAISPRESLPQPGSAPAPNPIFSVVTIGNQKKYLAIRMELLNASCRWYGDPSKVHDRKNHVGQPFNSMFGRPVPEGICAEYTKLWKANPAMRHPLPDPKLRDNSNDAMSKEKKFKDHEARIAASVDLQPRLNKDVYTEPQAGAGVLIVKEDLSEVQYEQSDYSKRS